MWFLIAAALAGPADDFAGRWTIDPAHSDLDDRALAALPDGSAPADLPEGAPPLPTHPVGADARSSHLDPSTSGVGGGRPDGAEAATSSVATAASFVRDCLGGGAVHLGITPTTDGLAIQWGGDGPVDLRVGGPTVRLKRPGGVVRVRAREGAYGLEVVRIAHGVHFTETLMRDDTHLVVVVETAGGNLPVVTLRRAYLPDPGPG